MRSLGRAPDTLCGYFLAAHLGDLIEHVADAARVDHVGGCDLVDQLPAPTAQPQMPVATPAAPVATTTETPTAPAIAPPEPPSPTKLPPAPETATPAAAVVAMKSRRLILVGMLNLSYVGRASQARRIRRT